MEDKRTPLNSTLGGGRLVKRQSDSLSFFQPSPPKSSADSVILPELPVFGGRRICRVPDFRYLYSYPERCNLSAFLVPNLWQNTSGLPRYSPKSPHKKQRKMTFNLYTLQLLSTIWLCFHTAVHTSLPNVEWCHTAVCHTRTEVSFKACIFITSIHGSQTKLHKVISSYQHYSKISILNICSALDNKILCTGCLILLATPKFPYVPDSRKSRVLNWPHSEMTKSRTCPPKNGRVQNFPALNSPNLGTLLFFGAGKSQTLPFFRGGKSWT